MLPLVCVDAVAVMFLFDLCNRQSLVSIREWYRQVRGLNKSALPFLVGTKYDAFTALDASAQAAVTDQARKYAKAMRAPLVFCSSSHGVSINRLFRLVLCRAFSLGTEGIEQIHAVGEPLFEF